MRRRRLVAGRDDGTGTSNFLDCRDLVLLAGGAANCDAAFVFDRVC